MRFNKFKTKKYIISALCIVFLSCVLFAYALFGSREAEALPSVPTSTTVTTPIYNFDDYCYNQDALNELAKQILDQQAPGVYGSSPTLDNLISYATGTAGRNGRAITNKSVTLKYGRFRYTMQSRTYNDLAWMPVYISSNASGEAILTLYLGATETNKSAANQEHGYFTAQGLFTPEYNIGAPSNMYGASQMRSIALGAMKPYATYPNGSYKLKDDPEITEANCNKFTDFIVGKGFTGALYDDIETPSEMAWQAHETYADYSSKFVSMPASYSNYAWPNEAYDTPTASSQYYLPGYFDYNQSNKTQYNDWKNDKVWLPSLTEVGDGDINPNNPSASTANGVWQLSMSQRSNVQKSWLRTAKTDSAKTTDTYGNQYSTYTMFCIDTDGSITESDVNKLCAIRPAIHLNLSKIKGKTTPAVKLPDAITTTYNGNPEGQTLEDLLQTEAGKEQLKWYDKDEMDYAFYSDPECQHVVRPIDAGTYYIEVTLKGTSDRLFYGADANTRKQVTKFVIEKVKLDVEWEYDADTSMPLGVHFKAPDGKTEDDLFYSRDLRPQLSFYYKSVINASGRYDDYPDVMGHYRAYAYIINESMYKYNYELSDNISSNQFYVNERELDLPEFCYGPGDNISNNNTTLVIPYKGKNFIQIKNISPKMQIKVTASPKSALDPGKFEDLGLNEETGIQTFAVQDVARYTFTVELIDKVNTKWNTEGSKDTVDKTLILSIERAEITVTFDGLPSSWDSLTETAFHLGVVGVQAGDNPTMRVYYQPSRGGNQVDLKGDADGKYIIPKGLSVGEYTLVAGIAGSGGPYLVPGSGTVTQRFTVTQANSNFNESLVSWQYSVDGRTTTLTEYGSGNTSSTAVEVDFKNSYYQFTLQMTEERLQQYYYVKAEYTDAAYVKDAGSYYVTVTISAYDKNVSFATQTYKFWFKIKKAKFEDFNDMSGVEWDYPGPLQHTGNECKVLLSNVPYGVTVNYTGNKGTDVGTYNAQAEFVLSDEYAKNYEAPESMSLSWEIASSGITQKLNYDTSNVRLLYTHGTELKTASWNSEQKKWEIGGKEFILSFPYDGAQHTIDLTGLPTGLNMGTPNGNSYVNAGNYTARFYLDGDTAVYNIPEFTDISWTVEKGEINFDHVKWGYIDSNGNEYEIDFDLNPFTFTRDEDGPVNFTVGLINLPEELKGGIRYSTTCLTKANSGAVTGNSFAEAGDYQTTFVRNINFTGNSNYVPLASIPAFVPSFQYWKIQERQFTELSYDGSWKEFDNRPHDLLALCGMPKDELDYFKVEIIFLDANNNLEKYYFEDNKYYKDGEEIEDFAAYHAGTYILKFFELRGADEVEYFWDSVEIVVGKEKLEVTWDSKGSIPVARVTGLYVTDMIGTKYTVESEDGSEVMEEYIKSSNGVQFYAQPYVKKGYSGDIEIVMAGDEKLIRGFTYWMYTPSAGSHQINKNDIRFESDKEEYTGSPITFRLMYWDWEFASYLYYEGDSLTQTEVGVYTIDVNFINYDSATGTGDAYWQNTDGDRSPYALTFEITAPSSLALDYPKLDKTSASYTGSPINFTITNWTLLSQYLKYEVSYEGTPIFGQKLSFTAAGNYTITFSFLPDSIGYWKNPVNDPHENYTLTFRIVNGSTSAPITNPRLVSSIKEGTGKPLTFEIENADYYKGYCDISGDDLTQTNPGTYNVTLTIKDSYPDLMFVNGSRTITLTFTIEEPSGPRHIPLPVVSQPTREYTGYDMSFVDNWDELSKYVDIVGISGSLVGQGSYIQKAIGEYTFYLRIKEDYKETVFWMDEEDSLKMISFRIVPATVDTDKLAAGGDGKITAPNGDGTDVDFDNYFDYKYYDKDGVLVVDEDGNPVGPDALTDGEDYTLSVTLKPEKRDEFYDSFANAEEIENAVSNKPFEFTYVGDEDYKILIIIIIAEVAVVVFLIIATVIVLLIQRKMYDQVEDYYSRNDDYEEDDE